MRKLFTLKEIDNLDIKTIHKLYKEYVSKSQVDLIGSFGFGNDTVEYAEGSYLYLKMEKKSLILLEELAYLDTVTIIQEF